MNKTKELKDLNSNSQKSCVLLDYFYNPKAHAIYFNKNEQIDSLFYRICSTQKTSFVDYYLFFGEELFPYKMIGGGCPGEIKDIAPIKTIELFIDSIDYLKNDVSVETASRKFGRIVDDLFNRQIVLGCSDILFEIIVSKDSQVKCFQKMLFVINKWYVEFLLRSDCYNNEDCRGEDLKLFLQENNLQVLFYPIENNTREYCKFCK
ncbi:MAG: hypothetical protein CVU14_12140 [Bacteroidetes bacterium HGW-Bacteroidetes-9]|jgi:hypothetical protein|nr:MAG: hypothetical protein CVU14_12140 [Bacteroidetes bacterium HGW-Bacteroidetes-9]